MIIIFSLLLSVSDGARFPDGFKFGAATSSYQIEGAWNISDKTPSIWDEHTHTKPWHIGDKSNGDVACDSYNLWRDDVQAAADLGLHYYRFSLAWTRILPNGFSNYISEEGARYYSQLIDALLQRGVEPVVTIYHWDLPQSLQDLGGWANPLIVEWFKDYARVAFQLFGDRVKTWLTINEPVVICEMGYNVGVFAPGLTNIAGKYLCIRNVLMAHAAAWRVYDEEFRSQYKGQVSFTNQIVWFDDYSKEDEGLSEMLMQYGAAVYAHPVYSKEGGWPRIVEELIAKQSEQEGFPRSMLPVLSEEEIQFLKGTFDFFGFNYYTSRLVRQGKPGEHAMWPLTGCPEFNAVFEYDPTWKRGATQWFFSNPPALRRLLNWLKNTYGDLDIRIMENGFATTGYGLDDQDRIQYYQEHLTQVLQAITEDGINVTHYTAWSLIDNFEWTDGYEAKFGLIEVDFTDPKRPRRQRASAQYYAKVIETHSVEYR